MRKRGSGILLHISSLPSPFGIGDLGPGAYWFADFLAESKQTYWQILPLNPTDRSPYHSISAFAANPLFISPEVMVKDGWLEQSDLSTVPSFPEERVDYDAVIPYRQDLLRRGFARFLKRGQTAPFRAFCLQHGYWLDDFVLFAALKAHHGGASWLDWPEPLRNREKNALSRARRELAQDLLEHKFYQYLVYRQWSSLKSYCNRKGIQVVGDIPIYVTHDSADVWAHPELFKLDGQMEPKVVAGVPPDYFSETGQLWGNPVYNWDVLKEQAYDWWIQRFSRNFKLFDFVRVDHFRGLVACWEVPAQEQYAINGTWVEVPIRDFMSHLCKAFPCFPVIAEDLGYITADVREAMREFQLPGMKLLVFAFGEDLPTNPYIPHNLERNCVAYTGTHDNNTVKGWFRREAGREEKERLSQYLGRTVTEENVHWELVRLAMMSVADTAIFPLQDVLGLGEEARMNRPATDRGNWQWRMASDRMPASLAKRLRAMTRIYGRA